MAPPTTGEGADAVLTARIPRLTKGELEALLASSYGLAAETMDPLSGERDQNLAVSASGGQRYVLKIANAGEPAEALAFQNAALDHVALADPDLPVPRVIRTTGGESIVPVIHDGTVFQARLVTHLPGEPALDSLARPAFRHALGRLVARLDRALDGFDHPGADTDMIWDLRRASALRDRIRFIADPARRAMAERVMDDFDRTAVPIFPALRRQVIHNDINQNNIMRDARGGAISGIIDFGDMVRTCLVNEVAITIAHQLYRQPDVGAVGAEVLEGYTAEIPLEPDESAILFDLVKMRLLTREIIAAWRASTGSGTTPYRSDISALGWQALSRAIELDPERTTRLWRLP